MADPAAVANYLRGMASDALGNAYTVSLLDAEMCRTAANLIDPQPVWLREVCVNAMHDIEPDADRAVVDAVLAIVCEHITAVPTTRDDGSDRYASLYSADILALFGVAR